MDAPTAVTQGTFCIQPREPDSAPAGLSQQKNSLDVLTEEHEFFTGSCTPICHVQDEQSID